MQTSHLDDILDALKDRSRNVYGPSETTIMGNYIEAVKALGIPHTIRHNKKGHPFIEMHREDGSRLAYIHTRLLPSCSKTSSAICNDKVATHDLLEPKGVRIPRSRVYRENEAEKALAESYADNSEVVIKAHSLTLGVGVFLNVRKESFIETFAECIAIQKSYGHDPVAIVQEMVPGFEIRAVVIEGRLDNAVIRIPAYVTGDGESTIDALIDAKNAERSKCGFFHDKPIRRNRNMHAQLSGAGLSLDSVPAEGENVLLTSISNSTYGGETAIVTDLVSDEFKEMAVRAVAAIPGMATGGVDVMVDSFGSTDPVVLEVNAYPFAHLSIYPTFGEGTNPLIHFLEAFLARDKVTHDPGALLTTKEQRYLVDYMRFYAMRDEMTVKVMAAQS
ncbi:ATP-grasp domain-containing protein [Brachybacterium phenoliresistens]|uniref:ATP-grasp domain-containing protein n=1 Tax=Brachybacterium phenoliresistens TaxID=396014 RepID=UPI0031CF9885